MRSASSLGPLFLLVGIVFSGAAGLAQECLDCHSMADLDPARPGITIAREDFEAGIHSFLECSGCHTDVSEYPHGSTAPPQCSTCHTDAAEQHASGVHGQSLQAGQAGAARCQDCHGPTHAIRSVEDPASPASRQRLPQTCGGCHSNVTLMRQVRLPLTRPFESYSQSVHARALAEGRDGATCADCHGSHAIFSPSDARASVFRFRVPETCGACHEDVRRVYEESIHGQAIGRGVTAAAVCTDCHGEHAILAASDTASPVYTANVSADSCSRCHDDERLNARYNLPADRVRSYQESYHGLAARGGSLRVANCASCHGTHNILPSSDSRSSIAPGNLGATCGQCHPGAGAHFAIGPVHTLLDSSSNRTVYWIRRFYLILIPGVVGLMFLHNFLDWIRKTRLRFQAERARPQAARMTVSERWQHLLLLVSFTVLVWTGFALRYPEAFWAQPLAVWESRWPVRAWLHRGAATVLLAASALHLLYLATNPEARRRWRHFLPRAADWTEFLQRMRFNLGLRRDLPRLSDMSYVEKIEYWAVLWGTVIMAFTGLFLWSNDFTLRHLTTWVLDVATVVHYYEAILATLAIVVWHFYSVIFDPDHYPMQWTWITGTIDAEHWAARRDPPPQITVSPPKEESEERESGNE